MLLSLDCDLKEGKHFIFKFFDLGFNDEFRFLVEGNSLLALFKKINLGLLRNFLSVKSIHLIRILQLPPVKGDLFLPLFVHQVK